jgi:hypothetical protein
MSADDGLDRWIGDLRGHLERGDLAGLGRLYLGDGLEQLPGERVVRIMLADLDDLADPLGSAARDPGWRDRRRRELLGDFRRLRELLG